MNREDTRGEGVQACGRPIAGASEVSRSHRGIAHRDRSVDVFSSIVLFLVGVVCFATAAVAAERNVALANEGAVASASSSYGPAYPVTTLNDNIRAGGYWVDGTYGVLPDWVAIAFNGSKTIDRVVVYTLQDNYLNQTEPTDTQTFTLWGITDF